MCLRVFEGKGVSQVAPAPAAAGFLVLSLPVDSRSLARIACLHPCCRASSLSLDDVCLRVSRRQTAFYDLQIQVREERECVCACECLYVSEKGKQEAGPGIH